jgi:hypothetical protein
VAVIELSVGAGLVTVLFVFAISIAGDEPRPARPVVPPWLSVGLAGAVMLLLGWLTLGSVKVVSAEPAESFAAVLWQERGLDVLVQIVLIFAGVLGVLALLAESPEPAKQAQEAERASLKPQGVTPPTNGRDPAPQPVMEEARR